MALPPQTPIVNAGLKYVNGFDFPGVSDTTLLLAPGAARDSNNINDIILQPQVDINGDLVNGGNLLIDGNVVGANGVDLAPIATDSFYAIYIIGDSTSYKPTAALLSLQYIQPYLPLGYDMYRRIGWVATHTVSAVTVFRRFWQFGEGETRTYYYDDPAPLATTVGSAVAFVPVPIRTAVASALLAPVEESQVLLGVTYTPGAANSFIRFSLLGSPGVEGQIIWGSGSAVASIQNTVLEIPYTLSTGTPVPTFTYKFNNAADAVVFAAVGFRDYLF